MDVNKKKLLGLNEIEMKEFLCDIGLKNVSSTTLMYYLKTKYKLDEIESLNVNNIIRELIIDDVDYLENEPLISIVIPTYNRKEMLLRAINSVLAQNYDNYEILIIDDCSTDGTKDMIEALNKIIPTLKYFWNSKNMNSGYNRNLGYKMSQGKYIVFLDDDDFYLDEKFF